MLEHVKGHMGQKKMRIKLPCPVPMCEKKLSGRTQLQVHLNFHYDSRPYSCNHDDCNKTFRSNNGLKKHLLVHSKKKLFQCSQVISTKFVEISNRFCVRIFCNLYDTSVTPASEPSILLPVIWIVTIWRDPLSRMIAVIAVWILFIKRNFMITLKHILKVCTLQ